MNPIPIYIEYNKDTGLAYIQWNNLTFTHSNTTQYTINNITEKYRPIIRYITSTD
jgi:hypothetical protein